MSKHVTGTQEADREEAALPDVDGPHAEGTLPEDTSSTPDPAQPDPASSATRIVLPTYTDDVDPGPYPPQEGQGRDGEPLNATAFAPERMLKPEIRTPAAGWRRAVYKVSGGLINPGPSAKEQARAYLVAAAKTPVHGSRRIAIISRKGGVGKTTTTLMLGHTFAIYRGDRVVALDGNPDAGSLGYRVRRETSATLTDLLNDAPRINRYADIRAYTSQAPSRLEVVASDDDAQITQALGEDELADAIRLLDRHYNLVLLDTGTGILDSATQGILRMTDQIVIVTVPSLDGARAASLTLDWLEHNGYGWLVRNAVAVMNQSRDDTLVDIERVEEHFQRRCRATVLMPYDPHLQAGAESELSELAEQTRDAYLHLAAEVADGFRDSGRTPIL